MSEYDFLNVVLNLREDMEKSYEEANQEAFIAIGYQDKLSYCKVTAIEMEMAGDKKEELIQLEVKHLWKEIFEVK